jgi:aconitase A
MDVDWAFDTNPTIGEFKAVVSAQQEQKEIHAKITRETNKKRVTFFSKTMNAITEQEEEYYKNGHVLIKKKTEK